MLTTSADHAVGRLSFVDPLVLRDEGQVVPAFAVTVATGTRATAQHGTAAARGATAPGDLGATGLACATGASGPGTTAGRSALGGPTAPGALGTGSPAARATLAADDGPGRAAATGDPPTRSPAT